VGEHNGWKRREKCKREGVIRVGGVVRLGGSTVVGGLNLLMFNESRFMSWGGQRFGDG